jgi:hypothetical protein
MPNARTSLIAPGADRILHWEAWWPVFVAEMAPTPGRWQATLRAAACTMTGVVLAAMVGESAFAMVAMAAMTESSPGSVHSPALLLKRCASSAACALYAILLVAAFPQSPALLYLGILGGVWLLLYMVRQLPVGASGIRVAMWSLAPLFSGPLEGPAGFERQAVLSSLGVCAGVAIAYAGAVILFPGSESGRARVAVDGVLGEVAGRLRQLADDASASDAERRLRAWRDSTSPEVLAHLGVLNEAVATYAVPQGLFPELVPLTRAASVMDAATVHLRGLARANAGNPGVRDAVRELAPPLAALCEGLREMTFRTRWARPGDDVPEVADLVRQSESILRECDRILAAQGRAIDDAMLSVAGFARRVGMTLVDTLRDRPMAAPTGTAALALPLGFSPASPLSRAPSVLSTLTRWDPVAGTSALAAAFGLGLALVITALFLPAESGAAGFGAVFVLQSTVGGSGRRGMLRLLGTALGGALTIAAAAIFASGWQDTTAFVLVTGSLSLLSAWVVVGSPRTNYAGLMMAAAWVLVLVTSPGPPQTVVPVFERVASVMISGICVTCAVWIFATRSARESVMQSLGSSWTQMADLLRHAVAAPWQERDLAAFRRQSHVATFTLASSCDLREQYAFEHRLVSTQFSPVLAIVAEQQRALVLVRALAVGRFHDVMPPRQAIVELDASLERIAAHLEAMAAFFGRPGVIQPIDPSVVPAAPVTRRLLEQAGCDQVMVARLMFRRDALEMLVEGLERAQRVIGEGFAWVDGTLHSTMEVQGSGLTVGDAISILGRSRS